MASSTVEAGHPNVVSHTKWLAARKEFLIKGKESTHLREEMSRLRRAVPWEKVEKRYEFDSTNGKITLADLFDGRSQLIVSLTISKAAAFNMTQSQKHYSRARV
jgi:predicted dithiol-disulfide oxidoreductase (DUF899 family)